jgi:hypothetical protein
MGIKARLSKPFAKAVVRKIKKWSLRPIEAQAHVFNYLVKTAKNTSFGEDHKFEEIKSYADFKKHVPIRDYEELRPYLDRIALGEPDVCWPGKPVYLSKTSGTTSGAKYIPITKASMPNHINSARNALLSYIAQTGKADFVNGKMIFLQGSPELGEKSGIKTGRLSGIVAHHVPKYLLKNRMPGYNTNCIDDWETKVDAIVEETITQNMTLISGIPAWVQMYFEKLVAKSGGKKIKDIFPNFSLFVFGGVNFEPYRKTFERLIGKSIPSVEVYPASEGFIAFQDSQTEQGLLLVLNEGIFYEFIPVAEFFDENPTRIELKNVEIGVNYAIILNTNAGLWGYSIGDTVKFVSTHPYRIIVSGRIKHFTSAFGEHVIAEEVESSMKLVLKESDAEVAEFHVAPMVTPVDDELPCHEWLIEFSKLPHDLTNFKLELDKFMQEKNPYYFDLIKGKVLQPLKVTPIQKDGFLGFMKKRGKLGGQNKIPRLSNDRKIADELLPYIEKKNSH